MIALLARFVVRYPWLVILFWAIAGLVAIPKASRINGALEMEANARSITEAKRADQIVRETFPAPVTEFFAVAITGDVPIEDRRYRNLLEILRDTSLAEPYIDRVVSYLDTPDSALISDDGFTTFFIASLAVTDSVIPVDRVPRFRELIHTAASRVAGVHNFEINVTGGPALGYDARTVATFDAKMGEERALPLTGVVLILAFGALVAAVLPLVVGVFAITLTLAMVVVLSQFIPMSVFVLNIVTMVGLAVGIDYSLLIVTRFREELNHGHSRRESAWRTMQTAGKAVVTSGLTVAVGFAALLITPAFETSSVGVGGMLVVTFAVLLTITLLPAVLVILGRAIDAPKALASKLAWYHAPSRWERWARWLAHHPWRAILLGTVFVGAITWPLVNMRIGLPREGWFPRATESGAGVEQLERIGSRGSLQPLRVVIQSQNGSKVVGSRYLRGLRRLSDALRADPRVADVRGPVDIRGGMSIFRYSVLYSDLDRARERYPEFTDAYISTDGSTTLMDVILADTLTFLGSQQLVRSIRSQLQSGQIRGLDSLTTLVGGFAASSVDVQNELLRQFPLVVGLILVVTAVMLFVAFQSILVPIKAVIMNSLSVAGAFGLMVLVFQQGVGAAIFGLDGPTEAVYAAVPVLVFAVVFGLSMDYEVFLLSRIKEAFERTHDNDKATMEGLSATASVITSAATIMIIVFGVSAFSRVLAAQLIGFGLAIAVALDATIIRMVLVPAIMHIAGDWNWWPGIRKGDPLRRSSSPSLTQRDSLPGQFYRTP